MIVTEHLSKSFGPKHVLRDVSLEIPDGKTTVIIGKSGTGKSVLLKLIVGLMQPDSGSVSIDGKRVDMMSEAELYAMRRTVGYVFQSAALFDSMTVEENLVLSLQEHGERNQEVFDRETKRTLANVGLLPDPLRTPAKEFNAAFDIISNKKPAELSGGMRKRVGVARALVGTPRYIFYDEPTTGLDPVTSEQIDNLIAELARKLNTTSIVITHDMFSVYNFADKVVMLHEGYVLFDGTPDELRRSNDPFVREFIERYEIERSLEKMD